MEERGNKEAKDRNGTEILNPLMKKGVEDESDEDYFSFDDEFISNPTIIEIDAILPLLPIIQYTIVYEAD